MLPSDLASKWLELAEQQDDPDDGSAELEIDRVGDGHICKSCSFGDGYDEERLLTARDVADILRIPRKSVYELPITRVRLGERRIRWRLADVKEFINRRAESPA